MKQLTKEQQVLLNGTCRQLYLFWSDTTEKFVDASLFLSKKQVGYLYFCICTVVEREGGLDQEQIDSCNSIVKRYWLNKNRGGIRNDK